MSLDDNLGSFRPQDKLGSQTFQDLRCAIAESPGAASDPVFVKKIEQEGVGAGPGPHFMLDFSGLYLSGFKWKIGATIKSHS